MVVSLSSTFGPSPSPATTTSADFSPRSWRLRLERCPFGFKARSPQVRTPSFTARPPHIQRLSFDYRSFAILRPLAPLGSASHPVLVHRPAVFATRFLST